MSKTRKISARFAIVMGTLLLGTWAVLFASGRVEQPAQPIELVLLLLAEAATGLSLIGGGVATLKRRRWGARLLHVALGMLVYCTVYSVGVFAAAGNTAATAWFVAVAGLTISAALARTCEAARAGETSIR